MSTIITIPRKYRFKIDKELNQDIPAQQGDLRTRLIHFHLMKEESQFELSNVASVECFGVKSDNVKIYNRCVIEDVENGVISVELNGDILSTAGVVRMQLTLRGFAGEILSTTIFNVIVKKTLRNDHFESLESCDVLDNLIRETEATLDYFKDCFSKSELDRQNTFNTNENERENEFTTNEVDRQIHFEALTSDYENRINQMVIGKQQDLEVIDSRTSTTKGVTFSNLNARLEDIENIDNTQNGEIASLKNNQTNHDNRISGVETKTQENKDSITQLENTIGGIINGDVGIGNADTLDGHDSTYFATAQDFSNIINGTQKVGNADTLDGHDSTYFAKASHGHGWVEISDKPSSFPPSNHEHSWSSITGKPSQFTPASHEHSQYSKNGHGHGWSDISGKPSSYPPSGHTHTIWEITDYHHQHWSWNAPTSSDGKNGDLWFQLG